MTTVISGDTGIDKVQDGVVVTADLADGALVEDSANSIGYGTGAGGTVTQATSKGTAVTLNKPTGQITMNNASLGAGAAVSFTLNNSLIGANDNVVATPMGTGSGNYICNIQGGAAGSVNIRVTNVAGSPLTDALVINFAIIKGATA